MSRRFRDAAAIALLLVAPAAHGVASQDDRIEIHVAAAPHGSANQEDWIEIHSEHFVVRSDAGEERARRVATQLETIRVVFMQALPGVSALEGRPLQVFAVRDREGLQELLPQYRGVDRWASGRTR